MHVPVLRRFALSECLSVSYLVTSIAAVYATVSEKKEANEKEGDGIIFCNNNNNNNSGNNFNNLDWRDDEKFTATFNVPDMDISAGAFDYTTKLATD